MRIRINQMLAYSLVSILGLALGCSEEAPNDIIVCNDISKCDTCNTDDPLSSINDSLHVLYEYTAVYDCSLSADQMWCAGVVTSVVGITNVFVFNVSTPYDVAIYGGNSVEWSKSTNTILTMYGVYDVERRVRLYDPLPVNATHPTWSFHGDSIVFGLDGDLFITPMYGGVEVKLIENVDHAKPLSDIEYIYYENSAFNVYNRATRMAAELIFTRLDDYQEILRRSTRDQGRQGSWALSKSRTMILIDVGDSRGVGEREQRGLYLIDLVGRSKCRVMEGQYWGHPYRPVWRDDNTFFGTWFCRKESSSMAYLFNLSGITIGQLVYADQKLWL